MKLRILAFLFITNILVTIVFGGVFFDDFNRPDGPVGNDWMTVPGNSGYEVEISNGAVVNDQPVGSVPGGPMYRPFSLDAPVHFSATIGDTQASNQKRSRFGHSFMFNYAPEISERFSLDFSRTNWTYSNSTISFSNGDYSQSISPSFQFSRELNVDFTVYPQGRIEGTVSEGSNSFAFQFDGGPIVPTGSNFAWQGTGWDDRQSSNFPDARSRLDNLRLDSFDIVNSPTSSLYSPTPGNNNLFGYEVSSFNNNAVIGEVQSTNVVGGGTGSVHLFNASTGLQSGSSIPNPSSSGSFFGGSITQVDDRLLVGAAGSSKAFLINPETGSPDPAYPTYTSPNTSGDRFFGNQVATLGNDLVIADSHEMPRPGSVYRIDKNSGSQVTRYQAPSSADEGQIFGRGLTTVGNDTVVVGAANGSGGPGAVYVYNTDGTLRTFGSGNDTRDSLATGNSLLGDFNTLAMLDNDHVIVGNKLDSTYGSSAGAAYIYNVHTGEQVGQPFHAPVPRNDANFGIAVKAFGDNILIGASGDTSAGVAGAGAAYLFNRSGDLLKVYENPNPNLNDNFGGSVDFAGNKVLVGAAHDDTMGTDAGAAYLYDTRVSLKHVDRTPSQSVTTFPVEFASPPGERPSLTKMSRLIAYSASGLAQPAYDQEGNVSRDLVDPSRPTIVLSHGYNSNFERFANPISEQLRTTGLSLEDVNIVAYDWEDNAKPVNFPGKKLDLLDLPLAGSFAPNVGISLGEVLLDALGTDYDQPIQFIGHSLGTRVNKAAADRVHISWDSQNTQVTIFDAAEHGIQQLLPWSSPIPEQAAFIDNYITAFGNYHEKAANYLLFANMPTSILLTEILNEGTGSFHSRPQQWYIQSIAETLPSDDVTSGFRASLINPDAESRPLPGLFYRQPLNGDALSQDLYWVSAETGLELLRARGQRVNLELSAVLAGQVILSKVKDVSYKAVGEAENVVAFLKKIDIAPIVAAKSGKALARAIQVFGDADFYFENYNDATDIFETIVAKLHENSPVYAWIPIEVPENAIFMTFELTTIGLTEGDVVTVAIDDELLFMQSAKQIPENEAFYPGLFDLSPWQGQTVELLIGLSSDDIGNGEVVFRNMVFVNQVPEPTTFAQMIVLVIAIVMLARYRRTRLCP